MAQTVLIVDDHAGFRRAARALLEAEGLGLDLDAIFDYGAYLRHVPEVLERLPR